MTQAIWEQGYTQNRELSWLRFNDRVLSEAMDETVPLLERLKFIAIFASNLDEFFMIRVGSLFDIMSVNENMIDSKSGMTPKEQLAHIFDAVRPLCLKKDELYKEVEKSLRAHDISNLSCSELEKNEKDLVNQYFEASIQPILSPQIVDTHHPFPHLANNVMHIGVVLKHKNREVFGVIPVPESLQPVFYLPGSDTRYIQTEKIILEHVQSIFAPYSVSEKVMFRVTRNADVNPDDEVFADESDFRNRMKMVLRQRKRLAPVRLELSNEISKKFTQYFTEKLGLSEKQIYITDTPMKMSESSREVDKKPPVKNNQITQNVKDLLSSREVENIFENSDFVYMLNQAGGDRQILAKQLGISPHQLSYVTHSSEGEGLLFYGSTILPFVDHFPKDTELYRIMTTKPQELKKEDE